MQKEYKISAENIFTTEENSYIIQAYKDGKIPQMSEFVGIDPSINSTGVTSIFIGINESFEIILDVCHRIVPPTKIETRDYVVCYPYEKTFHMDRTNTELENARLHNFQAIAEIVCAFIKTRSKTIAVGIEGLSYNARSGSRNTSSNVYDLAGLNTLIRDRVTKHLESLKETRPNTRKFVASYPPKTVKAGFIHGNADKKLMYETFERDYGFTGDDVSMPIIRKSKNESYLFDVADSYAIAKRELFQWLREKAFPPPPPKVRKPRKQKEPK